MIEIGIRSNSFAIRNNNLRLRDLFAFRLIAADIVNTRKDCAQRDCISFRGIRDIYAGLIDDREFKDVVAVHLVELRDDIDEVCITAKTEVQRKVQILFHDGIVADNLTALLLLDRCTSSRLIKRECLIADRVVITQVDLLAKVGRITRRYAQTVAVLDGELEVLIEVLTANADCVNRATTAVPSVLNTCYEGCFLTLRAVIRLAKDVACMLRAVYRHRSADRSVECSTDDHDTISRSELRCIITKGVVVFHFCNNARQIVFVTKNGTHCMFSSYRKNLLN